MRRMRRRHAAATHHRYRRAGIEREPAGAAGWPTPGSARGPASGPSRSQPRAGLDPRRDADHHRERDHRGRGRVGRRPLAGVRFRPGRQSGSVRHARRRRRGAADHHGSRRRLQRATGRRMAAGSSSTRSGAATATSTRWRPTAPDSTSGPRARAGARSRLGARWQDHRVRDVGAGAAKHGFETLRLVDGASPRFIPVTAGRLRPLVAGREGDPLSQPRRAPRLHRVDSGAETLIVSNAADSAEAFYAAWSPDGGKLYYLTRSPEGLVDSRRCRPRVAPAPCWSISTIRPASTPSTDSAPTGRSSTSRSGAPESDIWVADLVKP